MEKPLKNSRKISSKKRIKKIPLDFAVNSIKVINEMPRLNTEPMYDITDENIIKIRELIDVPFTSFDGVEKYQTLEEKAAAVFCATIRGHKFGNGNKRTAVMLLLAILNINGKWTNFSWSGLYELAMDIASDTHTGFDKQVEDVAKILEKKIIDL